jgi:hypothetical protein
VSHLGDRVAALVDGQLTSDAVQRAHSHLSGCPDCRELVEVERLTKSRLATLGPPEPGIELLTRLYLLGGPDGPLPPRVDRVPGTPRVRPVPMPPPPGRLPGGSARPGVRGARRGPAARPAGRSAPLRPASGRTTRVRLAAAMAVVGALSLLGAGVAGLTADAPAARSGPPAEIAITPTDVPLTVPVWRGSPLSDR